MRPKVRHTALAFLLALGLAGCAGAPAVISPDPGLQCRADRGIGGTGIIAQDRGIGGTGMVAQDRGIGGTGIIGTVTGFGSICVNGFRVAYDDNTPVSIEGVMASANILARGNTVALTAKVVNGAVQASAIDVVHAMVGPVTAVADADGMFAVMNVPVNGAFAAGKAAASLTVGEIVAIDGLYHPGGVIDATRIASAPGAMASVRGPTEIGASLSISGVGVTTAETPPAHGTWAVAKGVFVNGALEASRIVGGPEIAHAGRLSVEGYLTADSSGALSIRGVPVRSDPARGLGRELLQRLSTGQRVQILGQRQSDGSLRPETIIVPDRRAPLVDVDDASSETIATQPDAAETSATATSRAAAAETPTRAATATTLTRPAAAAATELQTQRGVYGAVTVTRAPVLREVEPAVRPNTVERPVRSNVRPEALPDVRSNVRPEARPVRPDVRPTAPR
ncbi:MAG: DUF5666 domain-containing protein [Rhodospirillaceae bacterium]